MIDQPNVAVVSTPFASDETTEVSSVRFSRDGLVISVSSTQWDAKVTFSQMYGFRVLDELDLTEFWSQCSLRDGWLFEVTTNGWKTLELSRPAFYSGRQGWVREYLVVGRDECVSVLTKEAPLVVAETPSNLSLQPTAFGVG
ncbi:hypothetical protein [Rubrivivax benzoatilyticus]|uniref:Uncharacterized protein n=1 Tax=Rubrivivax benzoatilyticus TaxID=316997 RepID=A0ABX0HZD9_9BURK|nr:hypothetical protein [Rubrivivax benzoatilyticus]NHL00374.1 hypothetical protein [Rubrivivax benzoatilyticus]NHL26246.1 hypothetical protein [Rubrivivax benzoatilyticus]